VGDDSLLSAPSAGGVGQARDDDDARRLAGVRGSEETLVERPYDVVLALANEGGVGPALQARQPTVLLHATTSPNWQAQLHRHIAGRDDCIACRVPEGMPQFTCAEGAHDTGGGKAADASVPPLAGMAGLLLAAARVRLERAHPPTAARTCTASKFSGPHAVAISFVRMCRRDCRSRLPHDARRELDGTRGSSASTANTRPCCDRPIATTGAGGVANVVRFGVVSQR
jgi:hypothetical protein